MFSNRKYAETFTGRWKFSPKSIEFGDLLIEESKEIISFDPGVGIDEITAGRGNIYIQWNIRRDELRVGFCVTIWEDDSVDWSLFSIENTYEEGGGRTSDEDCLQNILAGLKKFREMASGKAR